MSFRRFLHPLFSPAEMGGGGEAPGGAAPEGGSTPAAAAPPEAGTPAATPQGGDWTTSLTPEARALAQTKGWQSPADALRDYGQLEAAVGRDKIALPGKDAKPEDWDSVYAKLGRPESADKYDLGDFKPPEGLPWNGEGQTQMLAVMHKAGLNNAQVQTMLKAYAEMQGGQWQGMQQAAGQAAEQALTGLKKEWGAAFDAKMDVANRAVKQAFGEDLPAARDMRLADGSYVLDNPVLARAFARLGESISEDSDLPGAKSGGGPKSIGTPADARAEIQRIRGEAVSDPNHPYTNRKHPEFQAMQQKMCRLYELANPGGGSIND